MHTLCRQLERWLTTPALVRETSRFHLLSRLRNAVGLGGASIVNFDRALQHAEKTFSDVVLAPNVKHSIRSLAASAANTRLHGAPFRHFLFYGPLPLWLAPWRQRHRSVALFPPRDHSGSDASLTL